MIIDVHTRIWPAASTPKACARYFAKSGRTADDIAARTCAALCAATGLR